MKKKTRSTPLLKKLMKKEKALKEYLKTYGIKNKTS